MSHLELQETGSSSSTPGGKCGRVEGRVPREGRRRENEWLYLDFKVIWGNKGKEGKEEKEGINKGAEKSKVKAAEE